MNWLHTSQAAALGRTLLHSLWEGGAVAVALTVILRIAQSARVRYAAACFAMILMVSALILTFVQLVPREPVYDPPARRASLKGARAAPPSLGQLPKPEGRPVDTLAWLVPFWMAGVLAFHLRGLASWLATRRLRGTGVCCAPSLWQRRVENLGLKLRLTQPVALFESCLADVPVVIGYLRPVILMPVGLLAGLPTNQIEAILLHELAHIRRHDYLVNLLQVFVEGLMFYHPAVWWISGVIRNERENCCDDMVVSVTGGALEYATALTALEQRRENAGMALAATGGSLMNRIQRLLRRTEGRPLMAMPSLTAAILTVTAVSAIAALQLGAGVPATGHLPHVTAQAVPPDATQNDQKSELLAQNSAPRPAYIVKAPATHLLPQLAAAAPKAYLKWAEEDVAYIITDQERAAFKLLGSDEEREKFVLQFWARRDPTPGTEENEFKQEHYRRIAYVNDHFGIRTTAGWRTDRGRIYIQFGPPDEIEAHSAGGAYQRPAAQGGGTTETFPFEQWRYRWIEGVGNNVVLEFVDITRTGEFRMTMDPAEKDALRPR